MFVFRESGRVFSQKFASAVKTEVKGLSEVSVYTTLQENILHTTALES